MGKLTINGHFSIANCNKLPVGSTSGNAGHAAERGPDRDRPDPTRTDAKTQSNSIYLAQVPQNSQF